MRLWAMRSRTANNVKLRRQQEARALSQWAWATRRQLEVAERREVSLRRWVGHSLVWSIRRWGERTRGVRELRAVIGRWRLRVGSAALHTWAERSARRVGALSVLRRGLGALVHHAMWRSFRRLEEAVHERTAESAVQAALSRLRHRLEARALSQWAWATRRQLEVAERRETPLRRWAGHSLVWSIRRWGERTRGVRELRAVIGRSRLRMGSAALHTWAKRSARRVGALGVLRRGVGALVHHAMWRSFRRLEETVHERTAESVVQAALSRLRHRLEARALSQWAWATRRQLEVAERREVSLRRWAGHSLVWSIRRWGERTRGVLELRAVIGRWRLRVGSAALHTWAERSARRVGALGVLRRGVGALVHHAMWRSFRRLEEAVHERTAESVVQAALSRLRHRLEARALSQWAWATRRQLEVAERREVSLRRWAGHSLVWSIQRGGERTRGVRELRAVIGRWRLRVGSEALHTWAERSARRVVALGVLRRGVGALVHHAMWRSFRRLEEAVHERTAESVVQAALSRLRHRVEARALSQWAWATRRQLEVAERREVSLRRWAGHSLVWSIRRWGERTRGVRELRAVIGRWRLRVGSAALHTWAKRSARRVGALGVLRRGVGALVHHAMWRSFRRLEEAVHERTAESAVQAALSRLRHRLEARALSQWAWATRRQLEVAERREVSLRRWAGHSLVWSIRRWGERTRGVRELRAVIGRWRLRVGSEALHTWAERSARRVGALGVLRRGVGALVHHAMWRSFRRLEEAAHERTAESVVQAALSRLRHRLEARALSQWAWATRRQLEVAERREVSLRRWAGHSLVWSIRRWGERTRGVLELRAVIGRWRLRMGSAALHTWAEMSARRVGALGVLRRGVGALVHHAMWRSFRRLEEAVHERTAESVVQAALSRLRHRVEARALSQWAWATRRQLEVAERREVPLRRWAGHSLVWSIRRWGERTRGVRELRAVIGRWRLRVGSAALHTWAEMSARRVVALGVLRRGVGALVHHAMWRSFRRLEEAVHERTAESVVQAALSRLRHRLEARALSQWAWATRRQLEVAERREVSLRRWAGHSLVWSIRRWGERTRGVRELRAVIGRWRLRVGSAALHTWAERSARRVGALGVLRRGVGALVHHAMWRSFRRLEEAVHERTAESVVQAALSRLRHRLEARALSQWAWATRRQLEVAERREVSLHRWAGHSLVWSIRRWGERTRGVRELRAVIGRWRLRVGSEALHTWAERSARRVGALGVLRRGVGALVHHAMWRSFRRLEEAVHERTAESVVQAALSRLRHRLEARALSQWAWATRRQLEVAERREVSLHRWAGHSLLWSIRRWGERTRGVRELRAVIGRWRLRVGSEALHTWAEMSARRVGALGVLRRGLGALVHHAMWRSFRRFEEAVHERTAESVVQAALSRLRHRLEARALSQWAWATRRQLEVAERREVPLHRWAGHSLVWSIRRWGERTRGLRELRAVIGRWRLRMGSAALHTWAERSARRVGALGVLRRGVGALVHHAMWRSFRRLEEAVHERTAESVVQAALSRLRHREEARALSQWAWATRRQLEVAERREVSLRRWAGHSLVWSTRRWGERTRGVRELRAVIGRWRLRVGSAALHTWAERSARRVVALGVLRRGVGALVHHAMWRSFRRLEEAVHERTAESVVQAALSRLRHRLEARALSQWAWATRRQLEVAERREVSLHRWAGRSLVWSIRRWGERTRGVRELRAVIGRWRLRVGSAALHTWAERSARRVGALGVLRRGVGALWAEGSARRVVALGVLRRGLGALVHHAMWRSFRRLEEALLERTAESVVLTALSRLRHRLDARALSQWAWATLRQLEVVVRRRVAQRRWAGRSLVWSIRRWGERTRRVRELRAVIGRSRLRVGSAALHTWAERSARRVVALGVLRRGVGALVHHAMWRSFRRLEEAVHERTAESVVQAALSRLRHRLEARALSQWAWATRRQLEVAERREVSLRRWAGHSLVWSIRRWGERTRGVRELRAVIGRWRLRVGSAALHTWAERSARRVGALGVLRRGLGALVHHAMWRSFRRLEEAVHERTAESVVQAALSRLRHRLEARALSQWAWATRRQLEVAERREVSLRRWAGHSLVWSIRRWGERTRGVLELRAVIGRWRLRVGSAALHTWAERSARRVGALGVLRRGVGALVHHAMWRSFRRLEEAVHERTAESAVQAALSRLRHREEARALSQWAWATRRQLEVAERREVSLRRWAGHSLVWSIRRWGERTRGVRELRAVIGRWRLRVGSAALHTWAERSARRVVALGVLRRGLGALVHHAMWRSFRRFEEAVHERTAESVVQAALSRLRHRLEARALSQWAWATRRQLEVAERREVSLRRWAGHSLVWSIRRWGERTRGVRELRAVIGRWRLRVGSAALHTWAERSARRVVALGVLRRGVGALVHHAMWRSFRRLEEAVHEHTAESAVQAALSRLRHREEARALSQWAWATRRQLEVAERREVSLRRWAGHSLVWSIRRWGERTRGVRELRAVIGRWRLRMGSAALRTWAERSARRVGALGVLRRGVGALVHHAMWRSFRRLEEAVHERTAESAVQAALSRLRHRLEARALSQWAWATRRQLEVAERREVSLRRWAGHSLVWSIRRWGERTRGVRELRAVIGRWRLRVGSAALHTWAERSARRVVALGVLRRGVGALVHHAMWRSFRRLEEAVHERTAESVVQAALSRLRHRLEARALSQWAWATRRQLEVAERREVSLRRWAGHSLVWSIRRWGERTRGVRELRAVIGRWRLRVGSAALHTWAERSARRVGALGVLRRGLGALVHHAMWRSFRRLEEVVHERTAESAVQAALSRLRHRLEARALSQWAWATRRQLEVAERREVSLRRWAGHSLVWSIRRWGERTRGVLELRAVIGRWRLRVGSAALHTWAERSARRVVALGVLRRGVGALVHHAMWRSFRRLEEAVHERTAESVVQAALSRLRHRLEARALSQWAWATRRQLEVAERREVSLRRWAGHSLVWSIRRWGERTRGVRELRAVIGRWRLRVGSAALHTWAERSARRVGALGVLRRGVGALVHHAMWRSFRRLEEAVHERTEESAVQAALSRLRHREEARALSQWAWATRRQLEVAERREVSLRRWAGHSLLWSIRRWGERARGVRELRAVIGRWRLRVGSTALRTWAERSARRVGALGVLRRGLGALVHHAMWRSFRRFEETVHERTAESVVQAALSRLRHRVEARALSQWAWATRRQLEVAERREVPLRRWAGHSLVWSIRRWGERTRGVRELRAVIGRWRLRVGSAALHTWAERSARRVVALGVLRRGVGALVHHAMWRSFRRLEEAVHERTAESVVQAALSRLRHRLEARALSQWAWATRRQLEVAERREVSLRRWAGHSLVWSIRRWGERTRGVRELRAVIGRWRLRMGSAALHTWAERSARRVGALGVLRRGVGALVHHAMWRSFRRLEEAWAWATRRQLEVAERREVSLRRWAGHSLLWSIRRWGERTRGLRELRAVIGRWRLRVGSAALHTWAERSARRVGALGVLRRGVGALWAWATRRQLEVAERREVSLRRWAGHSLVWSIRRWGERTRGVRELRAVIGRWRLRVGSAALHTWAERSARRVGALGVLRRGVGRAGGVSRLRHREEARALSQWAWATRRQLEVAERREVSLRRWAGHSLVWSIRRWGERTRGVRELRAVIGRWRLRVGSAALHTWAERSARRVGALGVLRRGVGALVHHAMWRSFRRLEEAVHERTAESVVQAALSRLRHRLEARALSQWAWATRRQLEVAERREVSLRRWAGHSLVWSIRRWGERTRGVRELRAVIGRWRLRVGSAALHTWAERSARRVGALGVLRRGVGALVHHAMWRSFRRLEEAVHERTEESAVQAALSRLRHREEARALSQWAWATRRQLEVAERREVSLRRWAGHSLLWSIRRWGERARGVRELRAVIGRWRLRVGSTALRTWAERSARRVGALGVLRRGLGALVHHAMWRSFRRFEETVHERTAESVVQAALSRLRHRVEARALSQWAWATRRQLEVAERREVSLRRWAGHSLVWSIRRWGERTRGVRELRAVIGRWRLRVGSAALHTWAERSARRVVALGVLRRGVGALVHHAMWRSFRRLEEAVHERTAESVVQAALSRLRHRLEARALSQWAWATRRQLEVAERREVSLRRWAGHSLVWSIRRWGERTRGLRELRAVIGRWRLRVGSAALHTWAERSARRVGALGVLRRGVGALVHHAMWRSFRRLEEAVHERTAESAVQAALSRLRHRLEARALSQWAWATRRQLEVAERREVSLRRWAGHSLVWSIRRWGERTRGLRELRAVIGRWRLRVGSAALHTWAERSARRVGALGVLRRGVGALVHHAMWRSFRRLEEAVHERTAESVVQAALSRLRHRVEARALSQWAWATRRQLEVAERREVSLRRWAGHSLLWSIRRWGERARGVRELRAVIGRWRLRVGSAALHTWAERSARRVGALGVLRRGVGALEQHAMQLFRRLEEAVHERTAESVVQAALSRLRHREEARALSQWAWATRRQLEVAERREVSLRRWAGHSLLWSIRRWGERARGVRELRAVIGRWRLRVGSSALHTWAERSARRVVALGVLRRGVGALVHHAMWRSFRRLEEAVDKRGGVSGRGRRRQLEVAGDAVSLHRWAGHCCLWEHTQVRDTLGDHPPRRLDALRLHHAMWRSFRRLEEAVHERTAESVVQAAMSRLRHRLEARALSQWAWATRRQLEVAERREVPLRRWAGHSLVWSIRRWGERTRGVRELRAVIGRWRLRVGSAALHTWAERSARRVVALGVLRRGVGALVHHAMWRSFRRLEEAVHERTEESAVQAALSRLRHREEARALSQWAWATRRQLEVAERREVSLRRWAGHSLLWSIRRWGERTRGVRELRAVIGRWRLRVGSAALHTWAERSARRVVALGVLRRGVGALVHHAMWRSFRRLEEAVHERTAESVVQAALSRLRHRVRGASVVAVGVGDAPSAGGRGATRSATASLGGSLAGVEHTQVGREDARCAGAACCDRSLAASRGERGAAHVGGEERASRRCAGRASPRRGRAGAPRDVA
ncbi:hypothetical protein AB1Y20_014406 [Prymnesium parvum]|uniref:Uncharacterized protein n=1 Tax=Prymnesium parvum TaxID=97485 RepID=A0AB34IGY7_PRYPA